MKKATLDLTPKNKEEERLLAQEDFRLDVQYALLDAMASKGIDRDQLSKLVDNELVDRCFSDECNISVRELGNIFHAIGVKCRICFSK